jgi:hypothetical protein
MVEILRATHEGSLNFPFIDPISGLMMSVTGECVNLSDHSRIFAETIFLELLGRSSKAKGIDKNNFTDKLPSFISAQNLEPFVQRHITVPTNPVWYISKTNKKRKGYLADLFPQVCQVYKAAGKAKVLRENQLHIAERCDTIIDSLAGVAIAALIDEATGYQYVRPADTLQEELLKFYIQLDPQVWKRQFMEDFYKEISRLRQWKYIPNKRTSAFAHITVDLVYKRIQPGLWEELKKTNPNKTRYRYHQMLTDNIGNPHLQKHLLSLIKLMKNCSTWKKFMYVVNISYPINNEIQTDIFFELLANNPEDFEQYMGFAA